MTITKETNEKINELLNTLYEYKPFRDFIACSTDNNWLTVSDMLQAIEFEGDWAYGATKAVIILEEEGVVLKMPFLWEDRCINRYWRDHWYPWNELVNTNADYCKLEWRNYLLAEQEGIADCFAETDFWGEFHGYPIYLQEMIDCDESAVSESMDSANYQDWLDENGYENSDENYDEFFNDVYSDEDDCLVPAFVYSEWDQQKADRFLDFCDTMNIGDKHSGNFGYRNGVLVAVDFSGYGCWASATSEDDWDKVCRDAMNQRAAA